MVLISNSCSIQRPSAAPESDHGDGAPARDRGASRPSGALTQVPSTAPSPRIPPRAPRSARAPLTLRATQAAALVQPGRACAEPADRPVLVRAGGFAGAGSCRHRRPGGRRHLPLRHRLSARGRSVRPPPVSKKTWPLAAKLWKEATAPAEQAHTPHGGSVKPRLF